MRPETFVEWSCGNVAMVLEWLARALYASNCCRWIVRFISRRLFRWANLFQECWHKDKLRHKRQTTEQMIRGHLCHKTLCCWMWFYVLITFVLSRMWESVSPRQEHSITGTIYFDHHCWLTKMAWGGSGVRRIRIKSFSFSWWLHPPTDFNLVTRCIQKQQNNKTKQRRKLYRPTIPAEI